MVKLEDGFRISKLNEKGGFLVEDHEVKSIYEADKLTGLSVGSLKACLFIQTSFRVWFIWLC